MTSVLDAAGVSLRPGPIVGAVRAPTSKSLTNRALVVAALADGTSRIAEVVPSDDVVSMSRAVQTLGATVQRDGDALVVSGTAGRLDPVGDVDAGASGTTMRFATAAAAVCPRPVTVTGAAALLRRPIGALSAALRRLGATVEDHGGYPPVSVGGGLRGGPVSIDVSASSQFASAVLLAAPYAADDVEMTTSGIAAHDYIAMTVDLMRRWGAQVFDGGGRVVVRAGAGYQAREEAIEYDASAAAHLLALAAASGGTVTVTNAAPSTLQPDAAFPQLLATMGCEVTGEEGAVSVTGPDVLHAVDVDVSAMPDQVTTVAALAALADGTSTIAGAAVTRGHESDRLGALATELSKLGIAVTENPDGLIVAGGRPVAGEPLDTYGDHRLAMAFAAMGTRIPGLVIQDPGCVAKTYPGFWDDVRSLGGSLELLP